jgi:hypothetical protein
MRRAHHEGPVVAQSVSNFNEGRRFDDRRWRGVSWGAFGLPTSCEKVEAEGGGHARRLLTEAGEKMERGGGSGSRRGYGRRGAGGGGNRPERVGAGQAATPDVIRGWVSRGVWLGKYLACGQLWVGWCGRAQNEQ